METAAFETQPPGGFRELQLPCLSMPSAPFVTAIVCEGDLLLGEIDARPVLWWSFTKTVLAAAALALVRDGKLALDALVKGKPYTLRQLLKHTAGVPNYSDLDVYSAAVESGHDPWPVDEMLARVQAEKLLFEPGTGWRYSNTGYLFVRQIIEAVSGSDIQRCLQHLVLSPLGVAGVSVACRPAELNATEWSNPSNYHPGWVYHGLLIGPPASAALLLEQLLEGRLLPASLLADMCDRFPLGDKLPGRPWVNFGYGLGLMIALNGPAGGSIGHTGAGPMSVAAVYRFADRRRTVATFAPVGDQAIVEWAAHEAAMG